MLSDIFMVFKLLMEGYLLSLFVVFVITLFIKEDE